MPATPSFGQGTPVTSRALNTTFAAMLAGGYDFTNIVATGTISAVSLSTSGVINAGGLISSNEDVLWADDPQRAVTLALTSGLSNILNTDVGPEPWPFVGLPDVSIDVRVARMLAGADGAFHLSGQFYVGGDGIDFRNSADSFDISVPMADQSLTSIATAQAAALSLLSEQIARKLGR